jgi:hypothetical protein
VSDGSGLDVRELMRLIAEQQASLASLQQLVVEHVLSESQPGPSTVNTSSAPTASDLVATRDTPNVVPSADEAPSGPDIVHSTKPEPIPAVLASSPPESRAVVSDPPATTAPPPEELPAPSVCAPTFSADSPLGVTQPEEAGASTPTGRFGSVPTAVNSRAGRYLNRPASAPARQVTNQELYRLSRLRDVGDVAQLVLQFGEYRGASLFQVAQTDPDYLRSLALTAQRPQVRAAAIQLVRALEASQQAPGRRRTPKTSSRRHDA